VNGARLRSIVCDVTEGDIGIYHQRHREGKVYDRDDLYDDLRRKIIAAFPPQTNQSTIRRVACSAILSPSWKQPFLKVLFSGTPPPSQNYFQ
jgi:hypothetical protein